MQTEKEWKSDSVSARWCKKVVQIVLMQAMFPKYVGYVLCNKRVKKIKIKNVKKERGP